MKAKTYSLVGMIVGAVCLLAIFISIIVKYFTAESFDLTIEQALSLIMIGTAPSIPFCPIYLSIFMDKIDTIKNGLNKIKDVI